VQYALNLPRDRQYLCARTLNTYRQLLREDESAQGIFEEVTAALIQELGVEIGKQRLDSTHVLSNMAKFGRLKLLAVTTKRFLTQLKRHRGKKWDGGFWEEADVFGGISFVAIGADPGPLSDDVERGAVVAVGETTVGRPPGGV
jgi:hypothetical protein